MSLRLLTDAEVGFPSQLCQHLLGGVDGEALQVGPQVEPGDPLLQDAPLPVPEGHSEDARVLGAPDVLQSLVAGGAMRLGDQPCDHQDVWMDILQASRVQTGLQLRLKRAHLVKNVDNLRKDGKEYEGGLRGNTRRRGVHAGEGIEPQAGSARGQSGRRVE